MTNRKTKLLAAAGLSVLLLLAVAVLAGVGAADPGHHGGDGKGDHRGAVTTKSSRGDDGHRSSSSKEYGEHHHSSGSAEYEYGSAGKEYGHHRVPMCHKHHTVFVALPAVKAHLRHHDKAGSC